ncbi:MAG: Rieske 2Fe-2S domain-containing protein, partial [Chloroflexota bacterium]
SQTAAGDGTGDGSGASPTDGGAGSGATDAPASAQPTDAQPEESPENPSDDPTAQPSATPFKASGLTVASIASVDKKGAIRIRVPVDAPSSLPAGDPALIIKLPDGKYVCYDAVCTHEGCRVGWDAQDGIMLCPCHGAAFDPTSNGAVLGGPTNTPLTQLPIVIDHAAGTITLKA